MQKYKDVYIFTTYFGESFFVLNRGYEHVARYTRTIDLFQYRLAIFPIIQLSHWFLTVMDIENKHLYILDPYIANQSLKKIINDHMQRLEKLENCYLRKYFENNNESRWPEYEKSVKTPPSIPEQWDGHNCGVFVLEFSRCLANCTEFDFSNQDMPNIRRRIKKEILDGKIQDGTVSRNESLKRRISNMDKETCWLNACIQLILSGLDHSLNINLESSLGKELTALQKQHFINPMIIKQMLQNEIDSNHDVVEQENIIVGQQCARDLFLLLAQNKHSWLDVYNLFHHVTVQTLICPNCQKSSTYTSSDLYRELACPPNGSKLRNYVELTFNCSETVEYMCEEGCRKKGMFKKRLQLIAEESSQHLIVILTRGISDNLNNYRNKVIATDDIKIKDNENKTLVYEAISVIKHEGYVNYTGESSGHYLCDVKFHKDNHWYSTNDENIPELISKPKVTKYGYIVLYKRK